jgi:hypothetical protein
VEEEREEYLFRILDDDRKVIERFFSVKVAVESGEDKM